MILRPICLNAFLNCLKQQKLSTTSLNISASSQEQHILCYFHLLNIKRAIVIKHNNVWKFHNTNYILLFNTLSQYVFKSFVHTAWLYSIIKIKCVYFKVTLQILIYRYTLGKNTLKIVCKNAFHMKLNCIVNMLTSDSSEMNCGIESLMRFHFSRRLPEVRSQ